MITGNLEDSSLAGLLQFLATEADKNYKLTIMHDGHTGEIHISNGSLVAASFGLLEGEDALCEFLSWTEGEFSIQRLPSFEKSIEKNLTLSMQNTSAFVDQSSYLVGCSIGLNTLIITSKIFGSLEWQNLLRKCPLEREDYVVLGWLGNGRTTRQAAREFEIDIIKATSILYRLLRTQSVEPLRPKWRGRQSGDDDTTKKSGDELERSITKRTPESASGTSQSSKVHGLKQAAQMMPKSIRVDVSLTDSAQVKRSMVLRLRGDGNVKGGLPLEAELPTNPEEITADNLPVVESSSPISKTRKNLDQIKAEQRHNSEMDTSENPNLLKMAMPDSERVLKMASQAPDAILETGMTVGKKPVCPIRTDALPLVTIDIERLLQETFAITEFGTLALNNPSLDPNRRQTLLDVQAGKSLLLVGTEGTLVPKAHLTSYAYCLERGYITSSDAVVPLTIDLLLKRLEIDQYLLQRRRITGDELRDLLQISRQENIELPELLIRCGYMTVGDLETLIREHERFAL